MVLMETAFTTSQRKMLTLQSCSYRAELLIPSFIPLLSCTEKVEFLSEELTIPFVWLFAVYLPYG